jgi:hypothetical protein
VSSDDPLALDLCRTYAERRQWAITYNLRSVAVGPAPEQAKEANVSFHVDRKGFAMATLLDLVMALEADAWIGTRRSNWGRLVDELRCTKVGKCRGPFVDVGDRFMGW